MTADDFGDLLDRFAAEQYAVGVAATRRDPVARSFAEQRAAVYRAALTTAYANAPKAGAAVTATDLALLQQMMRDRYTPEQIVTELERVARHG